MAKSDKPAQVKVEFPPDERLLAIERRTALPMLILSAALVPLLITPLLVPLPPPLMRALDVIDVVIWSIFTLEYLTRLLVANNKRHFVGHNVVDLATVVLPLLPHFKLASSARTLRLLRLGRILSLGLRSSKQTERIVNHRSVTVAAMIAITLICTCAALEYDAEHGAAGANILSVGDAFWWAIATVTSVGYGDKYPVTTEGRLTASVLMVVGIATNGLIAASLASVFIEERTETELDPQLEALRNRLDSIDRILLLLENQAQVVEARQPAEHSVSDTPT